MKVKTTKLKKEKLDEWQRIIKRHKDIYEWCLEHLSKNVQLVNNPNQLRHEIYVQFGNVMATRSFEMDVVATLATIHYKDQKHKQLHLNLRDIDDGKEL